MTVMSGDVRAAVSDGAPAGRPPESVVAGSEHAAQPPVAGPLRLFLARITGVAGSLVLGQVVLGLTYVFAARGMGPAGLGLVATCFAIGAIGATVFDLGLTGFQVREIANGNQSIARARALVRAKRRLVPLLTAPTVVACLLIMPVWSNGLLLGLTGWAVWEAQTANSLLRSLHMFSRAASAQLAGRVTGLAVTVVLLSLARPEPALSLGLVVGFAVEGLIDRVFLGRPTGPPAAQRDLLAVQRRTLSFGLVALAGIGQQLDTPVVTAGGGAVIGGIYAGAGRLLGPLLFLSTSMALVGSPWLAKAGRAPDALLVEEQRVRRVALVLCTAPLGAAVAGPVVIPWILGPAFSGSGPTFTVLAIGAAMSTLNQALAIILQNAGREHVVGRAIGLGLVLGLVISYVFAARGGAVWAAGGFTVSQVVIYACLTSSRKRLLGGRRSAAVGGAHGAVDFAVLEADPSGHRLHYVEHLLVAGSPARGAVLLTESASGSEEITEHTGLRSARIRVLGETRSARVLFRRAVTESRALGARRLILPDGDRYLLPLLGQLARRPRPEIEIRLLLMRTAVLGGPERSRPAMLVKPLLVQFLRLFPQVRTFFLTDALGVVSRRRGFPGIPAVRDPVAAPAEPAGKPPVWLPAAVAGTVLVGLFGVISSRKNLPLLVGAMDSMPDVRLVVGGRLEPPVRDFVDSDEAARRLMADGRLIVVDRMLAATELSAALSGVDLVAVLHDNDSPSGILAESCVRSTPVLVPTGGWLAEVVESTGIGAAVRLTVAGVASGIRDVMAERDKFVAANRRHAPIIGTRDFTDNLLGRP